MKSIKYALREILLVVIGISIAIQANNWNEERKYRIQQKLFLKSLRDELVMDTIKIDQKRIQFEAINNLVIMGKSLLKKNKHTDQEKEVFVKSIAQQVILTPINKNVDRHNNKISEGIIDNKELNALLHDYYETTKYNIEVQTKFGETLQQVFINHVSPNFSFDVDENQDYDLKKLRENRPFSNALQLSINYRNQALLFLNDQKDMAINIISKVDLILN